MRPRTRDLVLIVTGTLFALLAYAQGNELRENPFLVLPAVVEAAVFGVGIAFAASAWPAMREAAPAHRREARAAYWGASWLLLTWVFADTLTFHVGHPALDAVLSSHAYHLTMVLAGLAIARYVRVLMAARSPPSPVAV